MGLICRSVVSRRWRSRSVFDLCAALAGAIEEPICTRRNRRPAASCKILAAHPKALGAAGLSALRVFYRRKSANEPANGIFGGPCPAVSPDNWLATALLT